MKKLALLFVLGSVLVISSVSCYCIPVAGGLGQVCFEIGMPIG